MPGRLRESAAPRRKAVAGQVLSDSVLLRQRHNFVSEAHWRIALPVRLFAGTVIEESFLLIRLREISMVLNRAFSVAIVACASFFTLNAMAGDLRSEMEAENARWLKAFNTPIPDAFPAMYTEDALLFPDEQPSGCRLAASTTPSRTLRTRWPNPDGNAAKESQPHWMTPVVTVTPRLEQEFRYDQRLFSSSRRHTRLTEGVGSLIILDLQR